MTCGERMLELVREGVPLGEVSGRLRDEGLSEAWYSANDIRTITRTYCEKRGLPVPESCRRQRARMRGTAEEKLRMLLDAVGRLQRGLDRARHEKTREAVKEANEADRMLRELYLELRPAEAP